MTVVVPTRNSERTLHACLASLRHQEYPCNIVVVDNSSTDGTQAIALRDADICAIQGPERAAQRNAGARLTDSPILGFIDSDMVVASKVVGEAAAALKAGAGAVIVPEFSFGCGFWAKVRAFERSFYRGSDSIEAARFYRRDMFELTGGFDEGIEPGPEDWDLTVRVRMLGRVARVDAEIGHDEGCPGYLDVCRKKGYYGPGYLTYARKHGAGSLSALNRPYVRAPWRAFAQGPLLGAGLIALKGGEAFAVVASAFRSEARRQCARIGAVH